MPSFAFMWCFSIPSPFWGPFVSGTLTVTSKSDLHWLLKCKDYLVWIFCTHMNTQESGLALFIHHIQTEVCVWLYYTVHTDCLRASRALFLMSSHMKALERRWGVSYSGDHYPHLLYIDVVAASSLFSPVCFFLFSVLLRCIHREKLEDHSAPVAWLNPQSRPLMSSCWQSAGTAF